MLGILPPLHTNAIGEIVSGTHRAVGASDNVKQAMKSIERLVQPYGVRVLVGDLRRVASGKLLSPFAMVTERKNRRYVVFDGEQLVILAENGRDIFFKRVTLTLLHELFHVKQHQALTQGTGMRVETQQSSTPRSPISYVSNTQEIAAYAFEQAFVWAMVGSNSFQTRYLDRVIPAKVRTAFRRLALRYEQMLKSDPRILALRFFWETEPGL